MMDEYKEKLRAGCELCHLDLDDWSVEDVSELILDVMQTALLKSDSDAFGSAAGLFHELVCYGSNAKDIQTRFSESYKAGEQQAIIEQMETAVDHPLFGIRWNSISMLGRSGSVDSVERLVESFGRAMKSDPAILPRLAFEISWLSGYESANSRFVGVYRSLLERLVRSDSYMNRWAAIEIIQGKSDPEPNDLVEKLKADLHPLVRLQATRPAEAKEKRVDFDSVFTDHPSFPKGVEIAKVDRFVTEWIAANVLD